MARTPIGTPDWGDNLNADLNSIEALAQTAYELALAGGGGGGGGAVASVNSKTGVVVLNADDLADGVTRKMFLAAERTKLTGIATGATANSTDAFLRDRANHTGTQPQSSITNLANDLAAKAPLSHSHGIADLPAGSIIAAKWTGAAWPTRPTSRTDVTVQWIGGSESNPPPGISGDVWLRSMV